MTATAASRTEWAEKTAAVRSSRAATELSWAATSVARSRDVVMASVARNTAPPSNGRAGSRFITNSMTLTQNSRLSSVSPNDAAAPSRGARSRPAAARPTPMPAATRANAGGPARAT